MQIEDLLNASDLRDRVVIESNAQTENSDYEPIETWSTYFTAWAKIHPIKTYEKDNAKETESRQKFAIYFRACSETRALDASYRITYGSRTWGITGVREIYNKNEWIACDCESRN